MDILVIPLSVMIALGATLFYTLLIYWIDRHEKEPLLLMLATFVWGALPAVILAIILEEAAGLSLAGLDPTRAQFVAASVAAPVIEECTKALALWGLFLFFRSEFDGILDGIVYGALIGLGFGMTENIAYFISSFEEGGWTQWLLIVAVRSLLFGLMHAFYTGIAGAALGWARQRKQGALRVLAPLAGLGLAILAHGLHNGVLSIASDTPLGTVAFAAIADWSGILVLAGIAALSWRRERQVIARELAEEVALGTLAQDDVSRISAASTRAISRWKLRQERGAEYAKAWGRFSQAAIELAFKKDQAQRNPQALAAIPQLRQRTLDLGTALTAAAAPAARQLAPRFCPACGHALRGGERFCTHCGKALRGATRSTQP